MSARDSASGSSDFHGGGGSINNGGGGTANGGIGGGQGGGGYGGGSGYNGGYQSRQGLGTGTTMYGNTAFGRPGSMASGYATRDYASLNRAGMGPTVGSYGNFRGLNGAAMFSGPVQGQSFYGMNAQQALSQAQRAQAAYNAAQAHVGGLLGPQGPVAQPGVPQVQPVADPIPPQPINQLPAGYYPGNYLNNPTAGVQWDPYSGQHYPGMNPAYHYNPPANGQPNVMMHGGFGKQSFNGGISNYGDQSVNRNGMGNF